MSNQKVQKLLSCGKFFSEYGRVSYSDFENINVIKVLHL